MLAGKRVGGRGVSGDFAVFYIGVNIARARIMLTSDMTNTVQ